MKILMKYLDYLKKEDDSNIKFMESSKLTSVKISIIVPVYNVEKYISMCIDSILSQTFTEFELLLIDDGSPDKSGKICDEYARKDSRVRSIHVQNGGPSRARNIGLGYATGKWVVFVDADDWLDINTFEILNSDLASAEIIYFGFKRIYSTHIKNNCPNSVSYTFIPEEIELELEKLIFSKEQFFGFSVNKFFLRSIIETFQIRFPEDLIVREDEVFTLRYIKHIKSLAVSATAPYNYRILESSLSHAPNKYRCYKKLAAIVESELDSLSYNRIRVAFINKCMSYYLSAILESMKFCIGDLSEVVESSLSFYDKYSCDLNISSKCRYCLAFPIKNFRKALLIGYMRLVYLKSKL